jgi:O-antigen/teichoic acid export membrane protein
MATLGIYSIAAMLAATLDRTIGSLGWNVLFPLYSATRHSDRDLNETYASARRPLLALAGWVVAGIAAGGPTVIRLLYDPRYWEAGWMLQILVCAGWFKAMDSTNLALLLAVGRTDWVAAASLAKVAALVMFVALGYSLLGFPGAVLGVGCSAVIRYVLLAFVTKMLGFDGPLMDLRLSVRVAVAGGAGWLAVQWVTNAGFDNVLLHALVVFVVVTAFWARPLLVPLRRAKQLKATSRKGGQSETSPAA